uniref:Metalloendopeptidase n=1 Tax=Romanomermis culicivorax TaxID=13658 RepID=A0A915KUK9_ROMCU
MKNQYVHRISRTKQPPFFWHLRQSLDVQIFNLVIRSTFIPKTFYLLSRVAIWHMGQKCIQFDADNAKVNSSILLEVTTCSVWQDGTDLSVNTGEVARVQLQEWSAFAALSQQESDPPYPPQELDSEIGKLPFDYRSLMHYASRTEENGQVVMIEPLYKGSYPNSLLENAPMGQEKGEYTCLDSCQVCALNAEVNTNINLSMDVTHTQPKKAYQLINHSFLGRTVASPNSSILHSRGMTATISTSLTPVPNTLTSFHVEDLLGNEEGFSTCDVVKINIAYQCDDRCYDNSAEKCQMERRR